jgi:hypothetical protein
MVQDYADRPPRQHCGGRCASASSAPSFRRTRVCTGTSWRRALARHPEARFVTWFRDPVERLISHFLLAARAPANPTCRRLLRSASRWSGSRRCPRCATSTRASSAACRRALRVHRLTERFDEGWPFQRLFCPELRSSARRNASRAERRALRDRSAEREAIAALNRADLRPRAGARYEELRAAAGAH